MPFDQYRTVVAALDRLTTQVGRVADTMPTPVVAEDDAPQTPGDDAPTRGAEEQRTARRQNLRILLNQLNAGTVPLAPDQVEDLTASVADEIVEGNTDRQDAERVRWTLQNVLATFAVGAAAGEPATYTLPRPVSKETFARWCAVLDQHPDPFFHSGPR